MHWKKQKHSLPSGQENRHARVVLSNLSWVPVECKSRAKRTPLTKAVARFCTQQISICTCIEQQYLPKRCGRSWTPWMPTRRSWILHSKRFLKCTAFCQQHWTKLLSPLLLFKNGRESTTHDSIENRESQDLLAAENSCSTYFKFRLTDLLCTYDQGSRRPPVLMAAS